jgi:hypothetical protein
MLNFMVHKVTARLWKVKRKSDLAPVHAMKRTGGAFISIRDNDDCDIVNVY